MKSIIFTTTTLPLPRKENLICIDIMILNHILNLFFGKLNICYLNWDYVFDLKPNFFYFILSFYISEIGNFTSYLNYRIKKNIECFDHLTL